ncbi:phage tail tape measure protein [Streptomyces sp. NBC_01732]|uniref:phage tail tape measure protein n=1 Tax=Streptomyces sp. NBC_01732 TaxID=2975926 RepID=UPI00352DCBCD|nr:phage tail tape measure protein [Streptomyces sp. NBC_01732]
MAARPIRITLLGDVSDLTDALDEASNEVSAFGEKAAGLAAVAGAGIAAGIGAGIMEALDREAGTDMLAAQLGATPAEAKKLGEAAGAVYSAGYGESVEDANAALKALWQQGLVPAGATADEMGNISKQAMDVASVLGDEVGPTANSVGQMLKTGMAKNATEAFDILVAGTQKGANKAEDLLDTFNEYGVQFKKVGLDGKTAMGLIQQGLQGGARDADLVADSIKEFSIRSIDGSATTIAGFKSIGLNADDMRKKIAAGGPSAQQALGLTLDKLRAIKDPADRAAAATALFGTQAEDMGDALYKLDVGTAVDALGKVDGAAKAAGETMHDNAKNKITAFTRSLQTGVVDFLGGTVLPAIESLARSFAPVATAAQNVAQWIGANATPIGIVAGLITVVMLPALIAWGVNATLAGIANVTAWVTSTTTATTSAATQVLAHWAVIGGWIKAAAQAVLSAAVVVGGWVLMGAQALLQAARMAAAWLIAMGPVAIVIGIIVGLALLIWQNWDKIKQWTGDAFAWVWDKIKAVFDWIKNLFLNFTGPGLIIKHWDKIKEATAAAFQYVKDKAKAGIQGVIDFFTSLPGRISSAAGAVRNAALGIGGKVIDGIKSGLSRLGGFASSLASSVTGAAKGAINGVIDLLNWAIPDRLGWGKLSISLPSNPIPKIRAMGGPASGLTRVGERGPEWLNLPNGSSVVPNHAGPDGGGVTVNVTSTADPHAIGREVAWALRVAPR